MQCAGLCDAFARTQGSDLESCRHWNGDVPER